FGGATRFPKTPAAVPPRRTNGNARRMERGIGARELARRGLCVSAPCRHLSAGLLQWTRFESGQLQRDPVPPCRPATGGSGPGQSATHRVHAADWQTRRKVPEAGARREGVIWLRRACIAAALSEFGGLTH